jgi:hypothetical protein
VLLWTPSTWAVNYHGIWLDSLSLLVTVTEASLPARSDPSLRRATAVGQLRVDVLPEGNLTSLDGTSAPSNASAVVTSGSWGDVVCDGGVVVFSHTALVVAFQPPPNASYTPSTYTLQVSASDAFPDGALADRVVTTADGSAAATVGLPLPLSPSALRYLLPSLTTGTSYFTRVAVGPPTLPSEVVAILPRAVPVVYSALGQPGLGCACDSVRFRAACDAVPPVVAGGVAPTRPAIGECSVQVA